MRNFLVAMLLAATLAACSGGARNSSNDSQAMARPTPTISPRIAPESPAKNSNDANTQPTDTAGAPVEFSFGGISTDGENISYKIKVNTPKPISQVDIAAKYMDAQGKVVTETTLAWQNVVKSKKEPIEQGKTYDVKDYNEPGATRADLKLKRVVFADGSTWNAK